MKVLVAVDNDQLAKTAFASIEQKEWPEGTEFIIVHVIESEKYNLTGSLKSIAHQEALDQEHEREYQKQHIWLRDLALQYKRTLTNVRSVVITGHIDYCIAQVANVLKPDHVVMVSHDRTSKQRLWIQSICSAVVDKLPCSVEVLRPTHSAVASFPGRLLLAVDGSENALEALEWLLNQNLPEDVQIKMIMVLDSQKIRDLNEARNIHSSSMSKRWSTKYNFRLQAREWFDEQLNILKSELKNHHVEGAILEGDPVSSIVAAADHWNADLIVIGPHSVGDAAVDGMGDETESTPRALVEQSHRDILVIKTGASIQEGFKWKNKETYSAFCELGKVSK
ncbi:MAG: universal stress protein [Candidatus Melainabacteria bacterium]|nr:universal stress protein [Candidatus Melainabacteria bacterium]